MRFIDHSGTDIAIKKTLRPQQYLVAEIQDALAGAGRRLFVTTPPRLRRLAAVRQALKSLHIKPIVINLGAVRSRRGLDAACKRAHQGVDFVDAMLKLQRQAKQRRLAVVFHNFDACFGSPGEDSVIDLVWMEAKNHCTGCKVIFTARNPDFVARCFDRYPNCRALVWQITVAGAS